VFLINGLIILAIILITPKRIGQWFNNLAVSLKDLGFLGMVLISLCVGEYPGRDCADAPVASSHPPMFGFSACMTMIGFAYGLWFGVFLGSIASLIGAAAAWFSIRVGDIGRGNLTSSASSSTGCASLGQARTSSGRRSAA
jgi:hypothetical protein